MAVVVFEKAKQALLAQMVTDGILEKLGPDAPESLKEAARNAGRCFAETAKTRDLARLALAQL